MAESKLDLCELVKQLRAKGKALNGNRFLSWVPVAMLMLQAAEEIELAAVMIHDLKEQVDGRRPLNWTTSYSEEDVLEIFANAEEPIYSIEQELLRRGIFPTSSSSGISLAFNILENKQLVYGPNGGYIMIGSPAYYKLPDPKPRPIKFAEDGF